MTKNKVTSKPSRKGMTKVAVKATPKTKSTTKTNTTTASNWFDLKGYKGMYQISKTGRIRNIKTGKILNPYQRNEKDSYSLYNNGTRKIWYRSALVTYQFGK